MYNLNVHGFPSTSQKIPTPNNVSENNSYNQEWYLELSQ